ncbi:hypothetical protein PO124_24375 [Bacillus licheniformis]|nr:hypothetical protein [Bacillus licheniformis]
MLEHSKELFEWLEEGAAFYVCGDKNNMAKDVQTHCLKLSKRRRQSREEAEAYLAEMKSKTLSARCILI